MSASPIEIISASAGSGKTHRLAGVLELAVKDKSARPEAIIATTFTRKAAAELRERVRGRLLAAGLVAEAQRLNAAIMGTVNSVCGRIVTDFAFELGLSPELLVLDEGMAERELGRAMFGVIGGEWDKDIVRLQETFYEWDPKPFIGKVLELARANGFGPSELAESRGRCTEELDALFGGPIADVRSHDKALIAALKKFCGSFDPQIDTTQKTASCNEEARRFLRDIESGRTIKWQRWEKLAKLAAGKKSADAFRSISTLAGDHIRRPEFRADVTAAVKIVFDLAVRALKEYADYKEERGFIDFVDQECLALRLLDKPEVRERLRGEIDLVLVDEFQDTSPIQLAIFLKLAELTKRSVWVGDQKQSIFGFRGSDPELMNSAIETILKGREPETLPKSWRSRPGLVRLTSDLFARAFARPNQGIPANRVRLEPSLEMEPEGLGPFAERWLPVIEGRKNKDKTATALAAGIEDCLEDATVKVRDRDTGKVRPVQPKDIAVLCRANATCTLVAEKLAGIGVKSAAARTGLMKMPEARLMLAALRLWSDPVDALSAAEIARIVEYPGDPDLWLRTLVGNPGAAAFRDVPLIRLLRAAGAAERSHLGILATYDRIGEIIGIRDLCRRWGNSEERLANLNVLRAQAVVYSSLAADEGAGMTAAGLAAHFAALGDGDNDAQAFSPEADAVVISTWHRAKGLEWPIVILFDLDFKFGGTVPQIHVYSKRPCIRLDDPLAERLIRYWPNPYHPQTKAGFHKLMQDHKVVRDLDAIARRETLRLLYVGWTRARDRVVLAAPEGKLGAGMLEEFADENEGRSIPLLSEPADGKAKWGASEIDVQVRTPKALAMAPVKPEPVPTYVMGCPKQYPEAWAWPDLSGVQWKAGEPEILGEPIPLKAQDLVPSEMMNIGSAVHGFLAADDPSEGKEARLGMAAGLLKRWAIEGALAPGDLIDIADRLRAWVGKTWPGAKWHREWQILLRQENGSITQGVSDLILETEDGLIVIDHKSYPGMLDQAKALALGDAAQVQVYADVVGRHFNKAVLATYVHLPLIGAAVCLKLNT